ncbi:single-stranded-DNA-specific exonuclease RecJ [Brevibacillus centrosporus]|uniref:single-stranded-DNA-specific exonuclease RecJ n=1 Tax=Brevibacillus centrosporus TaxID=54910 RepID=UPI003B0293E6
MRTEWILSTPELDVHPQNNYVHYWARQFHLHPLLMKHLFLQGINSEEKISAFLYPSIQSLYDPFLLNDMKKAVIRIIQALKNQEKIVIFGDYDVDGMTASAILYKGLRQFGGDVSIRLPLRSEGYGITPHFIEELKENVSLVITVDNGSSAHPAMAAAKRRGIDVIVTDHHEILGEHPDCLAFINPKRSDSTYPFDGLCGAGVAFKLVQALYLASGRAWTTEMGAYIELAALGTMADMMPLIGENRIICWWGLQKMNQAPSPVFSVLKELLKISEVDSTSIGFQIAPIFNSCGRIDDPNRGVQLLIADRFLEDDLRTMIQLNQLRKELTASQLGMAEKQITESGLFSDKVIVVHDDFHNGIVGLLASRIAERYHKPAIVIAGSGVASARSVQGSDYSIIDLISKCASMLRKYGGHQAAAGFSVDNDDLSIRKLIREIRDLSKDDPIITARKSYLGHVPFGEFPLEAIKDYAALGPFGMSNPKPVFYSESCASAKIRFFGKEKCHLEVQAKKQKAIGFHKAEVIGSPYQRKWEFLYTLHSIRNKEFMIEDVRV